VRAAVHSSGLAADSVNIAAMIAGYWLRNQNQSSVYLAALFFLPYKSGEVPENGMLGCRKEKHALLNA
jgi:hypothetical protein